VRLAALQVKIDSFQHGHSEKGLGNALHGQNGFRL
jgi:hypothetical protein